jgi:oligopeptide/dipeptide ABC transporter ATP-binding protein
MAPGRLDELLLDVRGLKVVFATGRELVRAVDGVDVTLGYGEALGLVGESGCGKSVFARSLLRLVPQPGRIAAGEIRFKGQDLLKKTEAEMRRLRGRDLAIVLQDPLTTLNPTLRVGTQIAEPLRVHGVIRGRQAIRQRAVELMEAVRIPLPRQRYRQYPHEFSGGMRQRAVIAAALACRPSLLICDEPTTALDVTVQSQILDLLGRIKDRDQTAILFVSHDLAVVSRLCDRLAVMYAGRIVELGPARQVLTDPQHPYTQGLLACVPRVGRRRATEPIPGEVPNPARLPSGCKFHPRCPLGHDDARCRAREPAILEVKPGHRVACWKAPGYEQIWRNTQESDREPADR